MALFSGQDRSRRLIDHVFLPPRLPQEEDTPSDLSILELGRDAIIQLQSVLGHSSVAIIRSWALLEYMRAVH